jgi:hypothetical protein
LILTTIVHVHMFIAPLPPPPPQDADAEIVVITSATMYCSSRLAMRSKVYSVLGSIRWGCSYGSCVVPPSISPTGEALLYISCFKMCSCLKYICHPDSGG